MDFGSLNKGILDIAVTVAAVINIPFSSVTTPPPEVSLKTPNLISSNNLPAEVIKASENPAVLQDLNAITISEEVNLKTVLKKEDSEQTVKLVTVEEPPLDYSILEPTPKPTVVPEKEVVEEKDSKIEIIKEAKAETVSPSPSTTAAPTPTPAPISTPTSAPVVAGDSNGEMLFNMTNEHRAKLGLNAFEKDERICQIARDRAPHVKSELRAGTLHKGFKDLNLPYWATENLAAYQTMKENFNFLVTDYIHRVAIEGTHRYSCAACVGTSCSQIFTSFIPK